MWSNMFDLDLSILEKMVRPLVVYAFLLVGLRLAGKRELAQLNAMDLIVLLTLANTVQNAIIGPDNTLIGGLIGAATLLALNYAVVRFLFSHPKFDHLVEGSRVGLIEHGELRRDHMRRELITKPELAAAAHRQGLRSLGDVESATLEPGGMMSFVGKQLAPAEARHNELSARLDEINRRLSELQAVLAKAK